MQHFAVVVISGARQVGKSTLLEHTFPTYQRVVFDPVVDVGNARQDPELFLQNHTTPLILDEIQYCPELVAVIKRAVDTNNAPGRFILTGSQQWSVLKSISESLAGRAVFLDLEGFTLGEIAECTTATSWILRYLDGPESFLSDVAHSSDAAFIPNTRTLYETLWRGWLPKVDSLPVDIIPDYYAAYVRTYVERDVRVMLSVGDWQQFGRFVQLCAALSAQEVNFSQLGRDISVTPQTANRWLSVLKATFQWYEIPAFHGNTIKRISAKPKGYFADTGLICHLNRISSPRALGGHPMTGAMFETAVIGEIRKRLQPVSAKPQMYHWRIHNGAEVDLLLERDGMLFPIEIKLNSRPKPKDARGFQSLRAAYPNLQIAPGLVICPCTTVEQLTPDAYTVPWNLQ